MSETRMKHSTWWRNGKRVYPQEVPVGERFSSLYQGLARFGQVIERTEHEMRCDYLPVSVKVDDWAFQRMAAAWERGEPLNLNIGM